MENEEKIPNPRISTAISSNANQDLKRSDYPFPKQRARPHYTAACTSDKSTNQDSELKKIGATEINDTL